MLGVGMVHQHFMLVKTLTVAENVSLGREPGRRWVYDAATGRRRRWRSFRRRHGLGLRRRGG